MGKQYMLCVNILVAYGQWTARCHVCSYGDAPVHSLATALFLDPAEVHFFDEIGCDKLITWQCVHISSVDIN